MLNCQLILFSAAMSQTAQRLFLFPVFFVGATSLELQQQLSQFLLHVLFIATRFIYAA
jgi:hypothetical protein